MKNNTKRNLRVIVVALLVAVAIAIGGLLLIGATTSSGNMEKQFTTSVPFARLESPDTGVAPPVMNLNGTWMFATDKGGVFEATVADKIIKIVMKAPTGTSMVYWNGTFETYQSAGGQIVSQVVEDKAVLSKSKTKNFTVGDDTLSFSYTAAGVTKTVELKRV